MIFVYFSIRSLSLSVCVHMWKALKFMRGTTNNIGERDTWRTSRMISFRHYSRKTVYWRKTEKVLSFQISATLTMEKNENDIAEKIVTAGNDVRQHSLLVRRRLIGYFLMLLQTMMIDRELRSMENVMMHRDIRRTWRIFSHSYFILSLPCVKFQRLSLPMYRCHCCTIDSSVAWLLERHSSLVLMCLSAWVLCTFLPASQPV